MHFFHQCKIGKFTKKGYWNLINLDLFLSNLRNIWLSFDFSVFVPHEGIKLYSITSMYFACHPIFFSSKVDWYILHGKNPSFSGGVANLTLKTDIIGPPASALAPKNTIFESFDSNIPDPEREGAPHGRWWLGGVILTLILPWTKGIYVASSGFYRKMMKDAIYWVEMETPLIFQTRLPEKLQWCILFLFSTSPADMYLSRV